MSQHSSNEILYKKINCLEDKLQEMSSELIETQNNLHTTKERIDEISKKININTDSCIQCLLCNKKFNSPKNLRQHIKVCKNQNDNIATYERELGMKPQETDKFQCRFCFTTYKKQPSYSRHMNARCKERYKYELELQEKILVRRNEQSAKVINNGDYATNIIINMQNTEMNPFDQASIDNTIKLLIKKLESCKVIQQTNINSIVDSFKMQIHEI